MNRIPICPCCKINDVVIQRKSPRRYAAYCEECNRILCNVRKKQGRDLVSLEQHLRRELHIVRLIEDGWNGKQIASSIVQSRYHKPENTGRKE